MNKKIAEKWFSAQIYYNEPWEDFLRESLLPFVDTARKTGITSQYFFIRYWERGPHLRLRMKGDPTVFDSILKPHLEEHFNNYMETYPSVRHDPNYPDKFPDNYKWHPNNSLLFQDYLPETGRFGGTTGLEICEEQFYYSSQTVLQVIKDNEFNWSYDDAMGNAIQLHLTMAHAAGFSIEESIEFFDFFYKNWLERPETSNNAIVDQRNAKTDDQEIMDTFEKAYQYQDKILQSHLSQLWKALERDYQHLSRTLQEWHFNNQVIAKKLTHAQQANQLAERTANYRYPIDIQPSSLQTKRSILADFVHLTNNRLGIVNRDESFIAYIIMRSLQAMTSGGSTSSGRSLRVQE